MKLRPDQNQNSTQPQISKHEYVHHSETTRQDQVWEHPWNAHMKKWDAEKHWEEQLKRPEPPSQEAIKKARFIDKTYVWKPK